MTSAILSKDPGIRNAGILGLGALITLNILSKDKKHAVPPRTPFNPSVNVVSDPVADLRRQQWERMYADLKASLKITGLPQDLGLKGIAAPSGLRLKSAYGGLLAGGYGICGLPGIYVGGPRPDCPQEGGLQLKLGSTGGDGVSVKGDSDSRPAANTPLGSGPEVDGLRLKFGAAESSPQLPGALAGNQNATEGLQLKLGSNNVSVTPDQAVSLLGTSGVSNGLNDSGANSNQRGVAPSQVAANQVPPNQAASNQDSSNRENRQAGNLDPATLDRKLQEAQNLGAAANSATTDEEASALARKQFEQAANLPTSATLGRNAASEKIAFGPDGSSEKPGVFASADVKRPSLEGPGSATAIVTPPSPSTATTVFGADPVVDPSIIQKGDLRNNGYPIFDCDGDRAKLNRLLAGRPGQQAAIERTEILLDAASEEYSEASLDLMLSAAQSLTDATLTFVDHSRIVLARKEMMKNVAGTSAQAVARWKLLQREKEILEDAHALEDATGKLIKLPKTIGNAYHAGQGYGNIVLVQRAAHSLNDHLREFIRLLIASGIWEEGWKMAGEKTAEATWGPLGKAGFNTLTDIMDSVANAWQLHDGAQQVKILRKALNDMRFVQYQTSLRIDDLQAEIHDECDGKHEAGARP